MLVFPVLLEWLGAAETSVFHYNAAINACARSGIWQVAIDLLTLDLDM